MDPSVKVGPRPVQLSLVGPQLEKEIKKLGKLAVMKLADCYRSGGLTSQLAAGRGSMLYCHI